MSHRYEVTVREETLTNASSASGPQMVAVRTRGAYVRLRIISRPHRSRSSSRSCFYSRLLALVGLPTPPGREGGDTTRRRNFPLWGPFFFK